MVRVGREAKLDRELLAATAILDPEKTGDANLPVGDPLAIGVADRSATRLIVQLQMRPAELSPETANERAGTIERSSLRVVFRNEPAEPNGLRSNPTDVPTGTVDEAKRIVAMRDYCQH
jgi:hypothetical protein